MTDQLHAATGKGMLSLIPSHHSGALQGTVFVSVYLMFSSKSKHLKNTVCFDKNLGSLGSVLNLLEGEKINHCLYKNVFTRELGRKMQTYVGGVEKLSSDREKKYKIKATDWRAMLLSLANFSHLTT